MYLLILIKFATVQSALCIQSAAEQVADCDRHVMNMLQNPPEGSGKVIIEAVGSYITSVQSITEQIILKSISYLDCKQLFDQGTAQFLFYEMDDNKISDIKSKFKWNDTEFSQLKSTIDKAMDIWMKFLDAYFHEYGSEIEEPKMPSMFTA